ncbi:hypothetical protein [Thalassovita aquimarina]|uniref:Uncharacterized protein n=2 Tax=Thalassovita aquimarina TaxID=2785917 RepID=A0ABS5HW07_9RHOB|nr:hypothetical protein [Thalassovita aquimarina]MBR9653069.1 hypothetical protein [Thalassovita aquimarina]
MTGNRKTIQTLAITVITSVLMVGASIAGTTTPCDEAMNQIWSIDDAKSFEAIESEISALAVKPSDAALENSVSFPNEDDGC